MRGLAQASRIAARCLRGAPGTSGQPEPYGAPHTKRPVVTHPLFCLTVNACITASTAYPSHLSNQSRLPDNHVPDRPRTRSTAQLNELRAILIFRRRYATNRPNHGRVDDDDDERRRQGVPLRQLGRFRALLARRTAHIPPVLTHAKLRVSPWPQRHGSGTRQRRRALTAYLRTPRGFPVMPLGTCRLFRRVRRTRVTFGEIITTCGRRHGRCTHAPHGGVVVVGLEQRLSLVDTYIVMFFFVLAYIIT